MADWHDHPYSIELRCGSSHTQRIRNNTEQENQVTKKFDFYLWIKVEQGPLVTSGPIPPKKTSAKKQAGVKDEVWTGIYGAWNMPAGSKHGLDYGEAFSDEGDAKAWITGADGLKWAGQAESYSLAKFEIELK
jgi:hypothetical protein